MGRVESREPSDSGSVRVSVGVVGVRVHSPPSATRASHYGYVYEDLNSYVPLIDSSHQAAIYFFCVRRRPIAIEDLISR
jgi:hypothetical protein